MKNIVDNNLICEAVDKYSNMILRIAFQYMRNKADAQDVMQDVFVSLLSRPWFNEPEHLKAWLIRVTVNKCKNRLKKAGKNNVELTDNAQYSFNHTDFEVLRELDNLRQTDRVILCLYYFEGYTAKEIAHILGMRANTITVRAKRAREKLKAFLED